MVDHGRGSKAMLLEAGGKTSVIQPRKPGTSVACVQVEVMPGLVKRLPDSQSVSGGLAATHLSYGQGERN